MISKEQQKRLGSSSDDGCGSNAQSQTFLNAGNGRLRPVAGEAAIRHSTVESEGAISQDVVDDRRFDLQRAQAQLEVTAAALEDAERQAVDADTKAPFAGKIEAVFVQVGDYVSTGTPIAVISDFSKARIVTGVSSTDISRIASGETAQIILPDLGGLELTAKVSSVGSIKDIGWGLLFSTIITLFVIPALFSVAHEATAFLNRIKMRLTRQELQ